MGTGAALGAHLGMLAWNSFVLKVVTPPQSAEQLAVVRRQIDDLEAESSSAFAARNKAVDARELHYRQYGHWNPAQACVSHYFTGKLYGIASPMHEHAMLGMIPLYSGAKLGSPLLVWAVSKDGMIALESPWKWATRGASDPSAHQEYWAVQGVRDGKKER